MSQEVAASNNVTEDLTGGLLGKTGTITYGLIVPKFPVISFRLLKLANVSLATRLQLVEFLRGAKFPLAQRPQPATIHSRSPKAARPTGCQQAAKPQAGHCALCGRQDPPIPAAAQAQA
jgi:hypothetical protein